MGTVTVILAAALIVVVVALAVLLVVGPARSARGVDAQLRKLIAESLEARGAGTSSPIGAADVDSSSARRAAERAAAAGVRETDRDPGEDTALDPHRDTTRDPHPAGDKGARIVGGEPADDAAGDQEQAHAQADKIRAAARAEAERIRTTAREEVAQARDSAEAERSRNAEQAARTLEAERNAMRAERDRLATDTHALADDQQSLVANRERLRAQQAELARQGSQLDERESALADRATALAGDRSELETAQAALSQAEAAGREVQQAELVRISGLTVADARAELLTSQEEEVRRDAALLIRRVEADAQSTAKDRARGIVADAVQRIASDQTSQSVVAALHLPSDDLKGRIIGREGRNIRAFETVTGVNVIIDDTPEAVLLSCFDPVRREIGRVTLQALIDDGRIHPHRIEEAYERAHDEVEALCLRAAEDALLDVGISDLHPELVSLIGRLKYRTSYGQNVLGHLVETSHIARIMASEIGIDPTVVARGAFLHDIGKALTHEVEGSHAIIGADVARRHGESAEVVHCIEAHHDEVPPATVEAVLTQAADACSGGRPGVRREALESYVKRLEHIEAIASAKKGVEKVFAMQAGRELRVMVKPEVVDDLEAQMMAREVAKQIEEELTYPGQVRVTVIRESRATEVAR